MTDWRRPPSGDDLWLPIGLAVLVVGGALAGAAYLFEQGGKELQAAAVKAAAPAKVAPPQGAPSAAPAAQSAPAVAPPATGAVFRCQVGARVEYRDAPCEGGGRQVDVAVSSGVRFAEQRAVARSVPPSHVPPSAEPTPEPTVTAQAPAPANRAICDAISQQIANLDAAARQPQAASTQDRIREQLAAAKTRWANLKCHSPIE